jgi:YVTN family beta-propeller protein
MARKMIQFHSTPFSKALAHLTEFLADLIHAAEKPQRNITSNISLTAAILATAFLATPGIKAQNAFVAYQHRTSPTVSHSAVASIDTVGNAVASALDLPSGLFSDYGLALAPNGAKLYVTDFDNSLVSVVNVDTNTVISNISVGTNPTGIVINSYGTRAYVANATDATLSVLDTTTDTNTGTVITLPTGATPRSPSEKHCAYFREVV